MTSELEEKRPERILFKLDSGCSDHLVGEKTVFPVLKKMTSRVEIKVAKEGEAMVAEKIGEINATSNKGVLFKMQKGLYVPELRENLMSVWKMASAGIDVLFSGSVAVLKKNGKLATGHLRGSQYELELSLEEVEANQCEVTIGNLWHRRFGHIGQKKPWPGKRC